MDNNRQMSESELVSIVNAELARSINGLDDDEDISRSLDLYLGKLPGISRAESKDVRSSRIVSMDIMDAVEATTAEIMQMYSGDEIAYFQPLGPEDEDQSREESDICNYLFLEEYNGYIVLQTAIKDALLHRNGTVKVYWDRRMEISYETYEDIPEMALPQVLAPRSEDEQVEVTEQIVQESAEIVQMPDGMTAQSVSIPMYSIRVKRTRIKEGPVIDCVWPEQVRISSDHDSTFLQDCPFVAHQKVETESSLIEQGFPREIVEILPTYSYHEEDAQLSRSRNISETFRDSGHHSTRPIEVAECYMLIDFDGDGIAERRKVVVSGNHLLANDPYPRVCLISGTTCIMPHKYQGISLTDRNEDVQEAKTHLLRSVINGAQLAANPRVGLLDGEINVEDFLMSRTGGGVRMRRPDAAFPFPNPEIPPTVFNTLSLLDQLRRERGGSAVGAASQAQQVAGDTAHGIERTMSAIELYNAMAARTIGETLVRGIFLELHALLRENYQGNVNAQVGGKWVTSTPSEWQSRSKVAVQLGSSTSERMRQAVAMKNVIDMHEKLHAMGAPIVDISRSYRAIIDGVRLSGIKGPERYFIDPASEEGQRKMQEMNQRIEEDRMKQDMAQQMMLKAQTDLSNAEQIKASVMQQNGVLKAENDRLKAQLQGIKNDADTALKAQKQSNDFALSVTKLEVDQNRELSRQVEMNR